MPRRRSTPKTKGETLLSRVEGTGTILEPRKRPSEKLGPICCCPKPQKNRLGGCRPALRWISHSELQACCATCLKPLQKGTHKGREQTWALGLSAMFQTDPAWVDLGDLETRGDIVGGPRPLPDGTVPSPEPPMPVVLSEGILGRAMAAELS